MKSIARRRLQISLVVVVVSPGAIRRVEDHYGGGSGGGRGAGTAAIVVREEKLGRVRRNSTVVTGLIHRSLVVSPVGLASQENK